MNSCSPNKFLMDGESLYCGHKVTLSGPEIPQKEKRLAQTLGSKLQPKPNKKFLGLFYTKIWLHEKVEPKPGKEKGMKYWLKNKIGEKPVLSSHVDTDVMSQVIRKNAQDNGLFNVKITADRTAKKRQVKIDYIAEHNGVSTIGSFGLPQGNSEVDSLIRSWDNYDIKVGEVYSLANFKHDRTELADHIRDYGYFDFYDRNIVYLIDTSGIDRRLSVNMRIKPPEDDNIHRKYHVRDVHVYPTHEPDFADDTITYKRDIEYKGMNIHQQYKFVGKKSLHKLLLVEPDRTYSVYDYDVSIKRLINTGIFSLVNINYRKVAKDSLDAEIFLTPAKHHGVKVEVEANTSNRSFLGSLLAVSYNNDNLFHGAESLTLKASAGTEFQFINEKAALSILNFIFEARLEVPGLLPLATKRKLRSETMPKTYFEVVENLQKEIEYYTLNSLKIGIGYVWQTKEKFNHQLEPMSAELITLLNSTPAFDDLVENNPQLGLSFSTSMIIGPSYNFNVLSKRRESQRSYIYYTASAEMAGNFSYMVGRLANPDKEGPYEILGVPIANFAKFDNDIRHYWEINRNMKLVSRLGLGVGIAYGNSTIIPYIRQFFIGGPNSLRAFKFRSVGPGSYSTPDDRESETVEQFGDLRLIMNLEYRFAIYRFLHGALFVDAGNVWLLKDSPELPGGQFDIGQFYREIALGTGFGFRLDFDFFAFRVDLGIPVYKPGNEAGQKWLNNYPERGYNEWRKANMVWNIGIGYPF
ncbi:MAG: BamA/TamA family outer membrane protein [Bacteroidetes bacterium]|nr:BamA/TamA family outer membrane protein [Bacteroidota bacterium]